MNRVIVSLLTGATTLIAVAGYRTVVKYDSELQTMQSELENNRTKARQLKTRLDTIEDRLNALKK